MIVCVAYLAFFLAPAVTIAVYHIILMLARVCGAHAYAPAGMNSTHTFAIIIPAHNEESTIISVLASCAELDYPADKYHVFVVADNCSDRTAAVARGPHVTCLERHNVEQVGKGYALEWAFERILPLEYDAIAVLDADCVIERHSLRVFDRCLETGDRALQANYVLSNPDASPISYIARIGNVLEYECFYAPKSALRLAVMLVGTGMVFRKDVLQAYPWRAHSAVEDAEYTLVLANHDVRVRFIANVGVHQAAAERAEQLKVQRKRWAGGTLQLGRRFAAKLISKGVLTGQILLADAGFTLLIVSRPLVLVHLTLTVLFGGLLFLCYPGPVAIAFLATAAITLALYVVYFTVGVAMVGINARRARYLLSAPIVLIRLVVITLRASLSRKTSWIRTPR